MRLATTKSQPGPVQHSASGGSSIVSSHAVKPGLSSGVCALTLVVLVVVGALLRLDFMRAVGFIIDGDEAIVGLMGKHILERGELPIFYYGQHYMGSLESILASISFAVFGISSFTLQLVPLTCSLLLIVLMFYLVRSIVNERAGLIAAALMAVAPPGLLVWSSKARGGFIEVLVLGVIGFLVLLRWIRREPQCLRYPLGLGLVLGLAWWVNNQIVYFILPIGLFSLFHIVSGIKQTERAGELSVSGVSVSPHAPRVIVFGIIAFLLGSTPYWFYNIKHGFPSAQMFSTVDYQTFREHIRGFTHVAFPMLVGAQRFWQKLPVFPLAKQFVLCFYALPLMLLVLIRAKALAYLGIASIDRRQPIELLILFSLACVGIFAISSYGGLVQAPRYLLPLYVGVFGLIAICCEFLLQRSRLLGSLYLLGLLCFQFSSAYIGGRGITGEPVVFASQRVARDHGPLIETLKELGAHRIRTNYWIGYRLAFETKEEVTFSQIGEPLQVRIPEYEVTNPTERSLLPLVLVKAQAQAVIPALRLMGMSFSEKRAGEYVVLYDLKSVLEEPHKLEFSEGELKVSASGTNDPRLALDGNLDTRWGTGAPQAPGQRFEIELPSSVVLDGVGYAIGAWWPDRPRELQIEIEDSHGERRTILGSSDAKAAFEVSIQEGNFVIRFAPVEVKRVIFSQLARDQVFDWSIAEVSLFGKRGGNESR